jgi:hypothetical protein
MDGSIMGDNFKISPKTVPQSIAVVFPPVRQLSQEIYSIRIFHPPDIHGQQLTLSSTYLIVYKSLGVPNSSFYAGFETYESIPRNTTQFFS